MIGIIEPGHIVDKLNAEIKERQIALSEILELKATHPNIKMYSTGDSTNRVLYCAESVNASADMVDFTEDDNGKIYAWPRTACGKTYVYSLPPYYYLGVKNEKGFGIAPEANLVDEMEDDNISTKVIRDVKSYLRSKPPINYF